MIKLLLSNNTSFLVINMSKDIEPQVLSTHNTDVDASAAVPKPQVTRQSFEGRSRGPGVELRDDPEARVAFLETFSAEEERLIMRKVDLRFCVLIGLMYLIKAVSHYHQLDTDEILTLKIDVNNISNVKVLQVGQPSNILKELKMTADQYNWCGSINGVSSRLCPRWRATD